MDSSSSLAVMTLNFQQLIVKVEKSLKDLAYKNLESESINEIEYHIKSLKSDYTSLEPHLPPYFKKMYHEILNDFDNEFKKKNLIIKNFDFNFDQADENKTQNIKVQEPKTVPKKLESKGLIKYNDIKFQNVNIDNLIDTDILIEGESQSLMIKNVHSSKIYVTGKVIHEIFVSDCQNIIIIAICGQLRISKVSNSSFFVHTRFNSMIMVEDSKDVLFGPHYAFPNEIARAHEINVGPKQPSSVKYIDDHSFPISVSVHENKIELSYLSL